MAQCNVELTSIEALADRVEKYAGWLKAMVGALFIAGVAVGAFAVNARIAMADATTAKATVDAYIVKRNEKDVIQAEINAKLLVAVEALTEKLKTDAEQKKSLDARIERLERAKGWRP